MLAADFPFFDMMHSMSHYPSELLTLIALFKKLPGIGTKTAERFAFQMLTWPLEQLQQFGTQIQEIKEKITACSNCGCLKELDYCTFCDPTQRDQQVICLVSSPKDVYAIEATRAYKGLYHVISGLLSPLRNQFIEGLDLSGLKKRLIHLHPSEAIIALDSTLEGDATALYLKKELEKLSIQTSRIAFGIPMGSSLDYVDYGTLERALKGRQTF